MENERGSYAGTYGETAGRYGESTGKVRGRCTAFVLPFVATLTGVANILDMAENDSVTTGDTFVR